MPTVELAGRGTVAYRWSGAGPETVVLVNGSVFNYHQWDMQALPILRRSLGERGRFLQYDSIGVGGSSPRRMPFTILDLADELRDLLDALSVARVHLLGVSLGSLAGQAFLIRHRERARSFCGLGNPHLLAGHTEPTLTIFRQRVEALEGMRELWPQRIDRSNCARILNDVYAPTILFKPYHALSLKDKLRIALIRRLVYPALEGTCIQTMVDLFRYYTGDVAQEIPAFVEGLPQVRGIPILLLNGTADVITPVEMSRALVESLPEARLVELGGVTHMGPLLLRKEARPAFERYVAFLSDVIDR